MRALLTLVVLALAARPAAAACTEVVVTTRVTPSDGETAPRNAHVRVSYSPKKIPDVAQVALRATGTTTEIDVERTSGSAGGRYWLELIPRAKLAANAPYQVVLKGAHETILSSFTTGGISDGKAPTMGAIKNATWTRERHHSDCVDGDWDLMALSLSNLKDGGTGQASLWLAVWAPGGERKIDYSKPPTLLLLPDLDWHGDVLLPALPVAADEKTLRVGIKVLDEAGNESKPGEVLLKLRSP